MSEKEFYLEYIQLGPQVKVTAIDPDTGIEVCIIAPATASKAEMNRVAVDKLIHVLAKSRAQTDKKHKSAEPEDKRGGVLI
ncbi:MAG: hypothetical protein ABJM86_05600 [Hyphomicrobiales bacterium]